MHLNSHIYTQIVSLKLRNRDNKLYRILKASLRKVKIEECKAIKRYSKPEIFYKLKNNLISCMFNRKKSESLTSLVFYFFPDIQKPFLALSSSHSLYSPFLLKSLDRLAKLRGTSSAQATHASRSQARGATRGQAMAALALPALAQAATGQESQRVQSGQEGFATSKPQALPALALPGQKRQPLGKPAQALPLALPALALPAQAQASMQVKAQAQAQPTLNIRQEQAPTLLLEKRASSSQ